MKTKTRGLLHNISLGVLTGVMLLIAGTSRSIIVLYAVAAVFVSVAAGRLSVKLEIKGLLNR